MVPNLPMFHATSVIVRFLVVVWLFHAGLVSAADHLQPLTVGYSNFTGTYGPLWIAVEEHVGTKYGLDVEPSLVKKLDHSGFIKALYKK